MTSLAQKVTVQAQQEAELLLTKMDSGRATDLDTLYQDFSAPAGTGKGGSGTKKNDTLILNVPVPLEFPSSAEETQFENPLRSPPGPPYQPEPSPGTESCAQLDSDVLTRTKLGGKQIGTCTNISCSNI